LGYQAYARPIWPCIDHEEWCPAEPYIPVSKSATKRFKRIKEKFDAKRKAWADAKAKMTPDELKAHLKARREARRKKKNDAAAKMKKVANQGMQEPGRKRAPVSKAKKSKPAKKTSSVKKMTSPKKPSGKKPPRRKKR
jgi:DNA replication initiation complex subunit (GINS family)